MRDHDLRFFVALGAAVALLALLPRPALLALVYDRAAVARGEAWRLLTASFVHVTLRHLAWNLVALAVVAALVGRRLGTLGWSAVTLVAALGAGTGLLLLSPGTGAMAGLSAVLHGLAAAGAWAESLRGDRRAGLALLALVAAKLTWEQAVGPLPWSRGAVGGGVAVDAHLYGASAGLAAGAAAVALRRRHQA